MNKEELLQMIKNGMSTYKIAENLSKSQTTIRYWLRKYKIDIQNTKDIQKCIICNFNLTITQVKYCSPKCKSKAHYNKHFKNSNTSWSQYKRGFSRKIKLINMLGGCCSKCGYNKNISALHFHHLRDKVFNLDVRKISNSSMDRLLLEVNKCILLCANCHSEEHNPHCSLELLSAHEENRTLM